MEDRMVNEFENTFALKSEDALELIQHLFKTELSGFRMVRIFDQKIYFGAEYKKNDIEITFGGDRGYFNHKIIIGEQESSLRFFDQNMINVKAASEKNIRFAFKVLKRYLENLK